ncbi:MAG: hypothetical protein D3915_02110 [Candidatus Electrothrix sp. AU1_5]|nr:hypothetical protein [Candidatus Electrothrix gigas]
MKKHIRFDWAIKRLLRQKANFGILEGFLSELLTIESHEKKRRLNHEAPTRHQTINPMQARTERTFRRNQIDGVRLDCP